MSLAACICRRWARSLAWVRSAAWFVVLGLACAHAVNAAPESAVFQEFDQAVKGSLEQRLREPLEAAETIARGLSFVLLLLAIVTRLSGSGSDPFRSITLPLLLAAMASAYPSLVRGLRDGVVAVAEQTGGHGPDARNELTRISVLWLPPSSALASGAAGETAARAHGWARRLYEEIEAGQGLSEEARASLWQVASQSPSGKGLGFAATAAGGLLAAAAIAEAFGAALHASSVELLLALCAVAWAGLLLPTFSGVSRTVILQTAMAALWPLGWSIAHVCGMTLVEACCGLVHADALQATAGALADAGAIQNPADWIPAAVGVSLSAVLLLLAVPAIPVLSAWLASVADTAIGDVGHTRFSAAQAEAERGLP